MRESSSVLHENNKQIIYEYDGLNRLVRIDYPDTEDTVYTYGGADDTHGAAGKILSVTDASGTLEYEYGKLGEVIKETRTLATHLNGSNPTETAVMEYRSDYLGRMQWIAYPDGEKVTYGYDNGGQVISVTGSNYGNEFNYVTNILYDQYGQRTRIDYGNGTFTEYNYDPARRWLDTIKTQNKWGQSYQNISYSFDAVGNVLGYENNCLDSVTGNYKTKQAYTYDSLYQLIKVSGETTYNPYQSSVPEFKSNYSQTFAFDDIGLGNMTSKVSSESITPQKTIGDNLNYSFAYNYDENYAHRLINAGDRYYKYDANGNIICEQDGSFESNGEEVSYHKITQEADGVYSTDCGWGLFKEDDKGGSGKANRTKYKRTYKWNERNQLVSSVDDNYNTAYVYGQDGQRANKYTQSSETLYFSKMWTLHTDSGNNVYGGQTAKNIYLGETRIVTKLNSGHEPTYQEEYYKQYYYHSDHLGSASLISDYKGDEYQRIEYTPYGETWVEKTSNTGLEWLPYKFTAKELDEETGLYYYGARYLDPKYSMWISTDPALGEYIPVAGSDTSKLPGMGGVYNNVNLNLYHYAGNNPVKYTDPDGNCQKPSPQIIVIIFVPKNTQPVEPTMFKQTMFTKENGFSDNYSTTACNATAALNIVSMQYTKETGKTLTIEQGMDILKNVPNDVINKENANVEDLCPALNSMMKNLEKSMGKTIFKGKFGYSPGWCGFKKATLTDSYFVDAVKSNTFPEHYVNDMGADGENRTVYDTFDGKTKTKIPSDIYKQNRADYYVEKKDD